MGKKIVEQISGIFLPIINVLTAASIIKSILIILSSIGVLSPDNGIYRIFYAVSDGFFFFLPFMLAVTTAKQWKTDLFVSLMIPAAMVYPDILAVLENGLSFQLFGLTVPNAVYHSSVIPVILSIGLLYFVEKPCDKYIPEIVRGFLKPIICIIIILPVTFLLFGPLGTWIGNGVTKLFFIFYKWNPIVAGAFMGFAIQPMVVVGAHWAIVPVALNSITTEGYDIIMPLLGAAVYGQGGAALALGLMYKEKQKKVTAFQSGFTACLGVTEPALYSVTLPEGKPLIMGCIAGAVGGALTGFAGTHCISFAFPSILTCVAFVGQGFGMFLLSLAIGLILGFVLTILFCRKTK